MKIFHFAIKREIFILSILVGYWIIVLSQAQTELYYADVIYDISLQTVERPSDAQNRYGKQIITQIEEEGIQKNLFEDNMMTILWMPTETDIKFTLKNKTDHSIKIIWDEAAFVDVEGRSQHIIHSGVTCQCHISA
jgi:hypothetical protein